MESEMEKVAVIGLGQMGATLAKLLLKAGAQVHVWNRNPAKAEPLAQAGAVVAASAAEAVAATRIVLVCVYDYAATFDILADPAVRAALKDKILIQLTTGSADEARQLHALALEAGAGFLDGAIQVAPEQMGQPDTTILVSGSEHTYGAARTVLGALGGNLVYLGSDVAAAAVMDLATLSYVYGASAGFFQGAALAQAEGLDVGTYGEIVEAMSPSLGAFMRHEGRVVRDGDFTVSQSPLAISVPATERIENAMRSKGLHAELPAVITRLLRKSVEAGYGGEEFAAVVKVLRAA
jgi:3-hydroxyisobutyrate dehydrogenase-like beta-hydroxyacid dehydrogenase